MSGGSAAAGVTPETHTASTTPPKANYKDELEEALDNVRLSGASEHKSQESIASTELRLGFDARAFLDMEYYYQDMNGAQKGPVDFDGLKTVWTRSEIDELSYIYTNRKDEWVDLASLPTLMKLLTSRTSSPPPSPPPPSPSPPPPSPPPPLFPPYLG